MTKKIESVVICGAGIAGLTSAIALAQRGFSVHIVEQAIEISEVGAGIQLQPNANRVLFALGVQKSLEQVAVEPLNMAMRESKTGRMIVQPPTAKERTGVPHYQIHRADFIDILKRKAESLGVEFSLGFCVCKVTQTEFAVEITAVDGRVVHADICIAADGVKSVIRALLFGKDQPVFTGQVAYRGVVESNKLDQVIQPGAIVGHGKHFVAYYLRKNRKPQGVDSRHPGKLINFVAQYEAASWTEESWTQPGELSTLKNMFKGWDAQVDNILEAVDSTFISALYTREPLQSWASHRVLLVGDACHPTLPNLASGAAMAIEDAYIIAELLAKYRDDVSLAYKKFYQLRAPRCMKVQKSSERMANFFHLKNPLEKAIKYSALRALSKAFPVAMSKPANWTNDYDATRVVR